MREISVCHRTALALGLSQVIHEKPISMPSANRKNHRSGENSSCREQKMYFRDYQIRIYCFLKKFHAEVVQESNSSAPSAVATYSFLSLCPASLSEWPLPCDLLLASRWKLYLYAHLNLPTKKQHWKWQEERGGSNIKKGRLFQKSPANFRFLFLGQNGVT